MSVRLVITEKPSVAEAISKALGVTNKKDGYYQGGGYIISWCIGHLVGLADAAAYDTKFAKWRQEDLPILPEEWKFIIGADKTKQFNILKRLMHDKEVVSLICATDAGREGELIFRLVYEAAECKKPFERLWISSMENEAIRKGFQNLKDGHEYDNLYASALSRAQADWLVGINATRLFTVLYNHKLTVGRVQSPTLAMLVERGERIRHFQKENYYHAHIGCGSFDAISGRLRDKADAQSIAAMCIHKNATVVTIKTEAKRINPPVLYDLTTLQREANRLFGFTAQQTLDYTQSLYEKRLCTYPRTDSQFLTEDMQETAQRMVGIVIDRMGYAQDSEFAFDIKRIINNEKVSDHHAIIPTIEYANADLSTLLETEQKILSLIAFKLLCAVLEPHSYEETTAVLECSGHSFTAKGKKVLLRGWKAIEHRDWSEVKAKRDDDTDEGILPLLSEGQTFDNVETSITEHTTTPPKPFTEDTLLSAMENASSDEVESMENAERKGLGTPATRAGIIEKMVSSDFVERRNKQLHPSESAVRLISVLPERLKSPALTAEWENALTLIAKGELTVDVFMQDISTMVMELIQQNNTANSQYASLFRAEENAVVIGACPRCGCEVVEGKRNFRCQNTACQFHMWKDDRFFTSKKKTLTAQMATALLHSGRVRLKGLYSQKTRKIYDANVILADTGEKYVNYRLEFGDSCLP